MNSYKKPLGRSIAIGCILFTAVLCLALSVSNYFIERNALFQRYRSYITDILTYAENHIDHEDMKRCSETLEESETYKETLLFMDDIMNDFSIHYLYAIVPLNLNETANVKCIFSAEDDYNRYEDTEGNLFLGWISDDEYDAKTVEELYEIMNGHEIVFFLEKTGWSTDYTGAVSLRDQNDVPYGILGVDVDITALSKELIRQALTNTSVILALGIIYTVLFLLWTRSNITRPVIALEQEVVDYAGRSHGQRDVEALKFEAPEIHTDNEVEALSKAILQMTQDMQDYVSAILSAEERSRDMKQLADAMSELAIIDTLTGIRNKNAFTKETEKLGKELSSNPDLKFGMAMIDLNFLKLINDT